MTEKRFEPQSRSFMISFQTILEIYINDSKANGVPISPLKVVQKWPRKVALHLHTIPTKFQSVS